MSKLTLYKGLPASGKTTAAKRVVESSENVGRVNRDDLREMMFNSKWSRYREKIVIECEKAIAKILNDSKYDCIVDDTNFNDKPWADIPHEIKEFDTPVEVCIQRDYLRGTRGLPSVGRNVIVKMALRNGLVKWPDKPIVLCDIDGTLARSTGREKYLELVPKQWFDYYDELESDEPVVPIFKWVKELSEDHTIVIVSGRGAEWQERTLAWFEKIWSPNPLFPDLEVPRFPVFQWIFRDKGDHRPDDIVKEEFLKLLPTKPVLVIDDRPRVVEMWRRNNLRVIPVQGACDDF